MPGADGKRVMNEPRSAWEQGLLESIDHSRLSGVHTGMLALVFGPGADDESLEQLVLILRLAIQAPGPGAGTSPQLTQLPCEHQKIVQALRLNGPCNGHHDWTGLRVLHFWQCPWHRRLDFGRYRSWQGQAPGQQRSHQQTRRYGQERI